MPQAWDDSTTSLSLSGKVRTTDSSMMPKAQILGVATQGCQEGERTARDEQPTSSGAMLGRCSSAEVDSDQAVDRCERSGAVDGHLGGGIAAPGLVAAAGTGYVSLPSPARLLDTRAGGATVDNQFAALGIRPFGSTLALPVAGRAGVPADAVAVVLNVTVTEAQGDGFITVFPCGAAQPTASNLNYVAGADHPEHGDRQDRRRRRGVSVQRCGDPPDRRCRRLLPRH